MDSPFPVDYANNLNIATGYMKVLASRPRLIIMFNIRHEPHSVSELMQMTGMSQTALSHQLAKLRKIGMVMSERKGKEIYYSIANRRLSELVEYICYQFQCWEAKN